MVRRQFQQGAVEHESTLLYLREGASLTSSVTKESTPKAVLVALHPGTVNSALSAPFNGAEIGRPAADAAGDMLRGLDGLTPEETGSFYAYSGAPLPR